MKTLLRPLIVALVVVLAGISFSAGDPALAAPKFPPLTGRVVDNANVLSPQAEAELTQKLEGLENQTHRQLVVATIPSLDGYEIEDYGYQLGRTWGIGRAGKNDGALFIVAPKDRKVRIEVGYGLEPVLTDALSSVILQTAVIPKFKAGDMAGGVVAGTDAIIDQLALPQGEAEAKVAQAAAKPTVHRSRHSSGLAGIIPFIIFLVVMSAIFGRRRRRGLMGRSGLGEALPWMILGALSNSRGSSWGGGGGNDWGGGGGGGWSGGGGGSFGGGGSSGSW